MITEQDARDAVNEMFDDQGQPTPDGMVWFQSEAILSQWAIQELARREWQDEPGGDGWYWCEELDADAPPQKIVKHVIGNGVDTDDIQPLWKRWAIGGWVQIKGRVCKITERPS